MTYTSSGPSEATPGGFMRDPLIPWAALWREDS